MLVLMLASTWLIAPSSATRPCDIGNGTAQLASLSCIGDHCKSAAGDCTKGNSLLPDLNESGAAFRALFHPD
jgi:hypothetical protein